MIDSLTKAFITCLTQREVFAALVGVVGTAVVGCIAFFTLRLIDKKARWNEKIRELTEEIVSEANSYFGSPNNGAMINIITKTKVLGNLIRKQTTTRLNVSTAWTEFRTFVAADEPPKNYKTTWQHNIELTRNKADGFLQSLKLI